LRKCGRGTSPVKSIRENWVGEAVVFLGSANGSYITVALLAADGGKLAYNKIMFWQMVALT